MSTSGTRDSAGVEDGDRLNRMRDRFGWVDSVHLFNTSHGWRHSTWTSKGTVFCGHLALPVDSSAEVARAAIDGRLHETGEGLEGVPWRQTDALAWHLDRPGTSVAS